MPQIQTLEQVHMPDLAILLPQWGDLGAMDPDTLWAQGGNARAGGVGEVYGAWTEDGTLVAYMQLREYVLVGIGSYAEVLALLVHDAYRGIGVGSALLAAAEEWARARQLPAMILSSQVHRVDAHSLYLRHGYSHFKHSYYFTKPLD